MKALFATAALAVCTLTGCFIDDDDDFRSEFVGPGTLVVDWSIDGRQDAFVCADFGVDSISIAVETTSGFYIGEYVQACEAFATSIPLDPDTYFADAVLLDRAGREITTAVPIDPFSVFGDDVIEIPIDFPFDSFY